MERRSRDRLAEREGDGAEVENLRAELLNDPHTLLLLPDIRMWLYRMRFTDPFPASDQCEVEGSASSAMVVAALVVLLYCVCQYLMLFVDRGRGSRSYSSGSLDFRDVYISIVLFHGAYIWIKSRPAATSGSSERKRKGCEAQDHVPGVYRRVVKDKSGTFLRYKYEPRFKPPREKLDSGTTLQLECLSLGQYDSPGAAKFVFHCAAFYYGKAAGQVALKDGSVYAIPPMDAQEKRRTGWDKAKWVTNRAKQVFKDLPPESAVKSKKQSRTSNAHSDPSHRFIAPFPALSTSVDVERSETLRVEVASAGAEQVADGGGSTHEAIPARECSGVQHNVPGMENDAPEPDGRGNASGHDDEATMSDSDQHMIAELFFGPANVSSQQSSLLGFVVPGDPSPPQFDHDATPGLVGRSNLNRMSGWETLDATHDNIVESVKERDRLVGQVNHLQEVVCCQKKLLEDSALQVVGLQHDLLEASLKNSELQREIEQLRAANSQEAAAAKSQVETWSAGIIIDFQQEEGHQFLGPLES